jgi:hypothetical protein
MADRWTPETVGLISMKICGAGVVTAADACAVAALTALADAGLLLPPGGETREQWGARWESGYIQPCPSREAALDAMTKYYPDHVGCELIRRYVVRWKPPQRRTPGARFFGPWEVVDDHS